MSVEWTDSEEVAAHAVVRRFLGPDQPRTADLITSRILDALAPFVAAREAQALLDAADDLEALVDNQHPEAANPDQWLRDRAARIEAAGVRHDRR